MQFDEPQRMAFQVEVWDDEAGAWEIETNSIQADRIEGIGESMLLLANTGSQDAVVISSENLISGWTSGVQ
jgi:hypothetical protein